MNFKLLLLLTIVLFSCKDKRDKFNYDTSIASKVYESQIKYLDNTLFNYARISKTGNFYFQESRYLDEIAKEFQDKIKKGEFISTDDQSKFHNHFEKTFTSNGLIDLDILKQLKQLPIETVSDVDYLRLYIKNNFVCILLNNKLLPFNTWGTMSSSNNQTIKYGEEFQVDLATTACNPDQPNEWFLVKENVDTLTKDNIIDTLRPDRFGDVHFKTKKYKKGANRLIFVSRLNTPPLDRAVSRVIEFYVK